MARRPARIVRRLVRSIDVEVLTLIAVLAGWAVALLWLRGHILVAASAAAAWLVTVLFLVAVWDLLALLLNGVHLRIGERADRLWRLWWLPPAVLVAGAAFGRWVW